MKEVQNLSIVNIIHHDYLEAINQLAEILGMGKDSISIPLTNNYYACHSWWSVEKYIAFKSYATYSALGLDINEYKDALDNLKEYIVVDGNPQENFQYALSDLGLSLLSE